MSRWRAEVRVVLRDGIADPEGQTIRGGLRALGFDSVDEVRTGKMLRLAFSADDHESARLRVEQMCRRLLANPVMESFSFDLRLAPAMRRDE